MWQRRTILSSAVALTATVWWLAFVLQRFPYTRRWGEDLQGNLLDMARQIVLADTVCCGQKASTVGARPGWSSVRAVRTGSIVRIDDSVASRWGPRLVDFFRAVSTALARLKA